MRDPLIGVLARRDTPALKSLADLETVASMEIVPLTKALETDWSTDAHFTCYSVEGEEIWPRLAKSALHVLQEQKAKVQTEILAFDYDNEDHKPWTLDLLNAFSERLLAEAENGLAFASNWRALYTTRSGARLIYQLSKPIPVLEAESRSRGIVRAFRAHGIALDDACCDWTRLFRLPRVIRDNKPTAEAESYFLHVQESEVEPTDIPMAAPLDLRPRYASEIEFTRPKPSEADVASQLLLVSADTRARLRGRDCYGCLFDNLPIAANGARDTTIQAYVGSVASMLYGVEPYTPEFVYAIFHKPVSRLLPDEQTADWTDVLWRAVCNYWGREQARFNALQKKKKQAEAEAEDLCGVIIRRVQTWSDDTTLRGDREVAEAWIRTHAIVAVGGDYHCLRPDGYYDPTPVKLVQLPARIRELGMEPIVPIEELKGKSVVPRRGEVLLRDHATFCLGTAARFGIDGAIIENDLLTLPLFRRKTVDELPPVYSADVDKWLRSVFGDETVDNSIYPWLMWAPALELGPLPALFIIGPAGIGKKLLAQGLAEMFTGEICAGGRVFGRFRSQLLDSPIIHVDEGFDDTVDPGALSTIPDTFRRLVSGDPQTVEQKFRNPVKAHCPYRVLVTANNARVCEQVAGKRDLNTQDQEALAQRMVICLAPPSSENWLQRQGGISHTHGWIRSDSGEKGRYVIASHIQWLYQQRPRMLPTGRFLMPGNAKSDMVKMLAARSGIAPYVIQSIADMIEAPANQQGVLVTEDSVFITCDAIVRYLRNSTIDAGEVNHRRVKNVLDAISEGNGGVEGLESKSNGVVPRSYHRIDVLTIFKEVVEHGLRCPKLHKICLALYGSDFESRIASLKT